jgi:CBS domain containing-hemolysin-like protein
MLDENLTVKEALDNESASQFTRIPVYAGSTDNITGKVIRVDLFIAERNGQGDLPIKDIAKKVIHVSEKLPVHSLLDMFIKQHMHLFIVEDEYGQTSGIVTLEDVIETLLGREIVDESDTVVDMQQLAKEKYRERLRSAGNQQSDDQTTQK